MNDRFSDYDALDFVGPVGAAAKLFPSLRYAVFSDSVIVSAETGCETEFLRAVQFIYGQWYAEMIFVRGAIAEGEIQWVDHPSVDELFRSLPNLMYARVYGKALVVAANLEQKSGPGAITFLSEPAATLISSFSPNSVLSGATPILCWASEREANTLLGYSQINLRHKLNQDEGRRHAQATLFYWEQVVAQRKFLPNLYNRPANDKQPFPSHPQNPRRPC